EAGQLVVKADQADRRGVADRHIDHALDCTAELAVGARRGRHFRRAAELRQLRLRSDVTQNAGNRTGTEQRALRTAQHFEALQIEQVEVRREQGNGDRRLVEVHADLRLHARLIADDL